MLPPAPPRFSTTTGCPRRSESACAIILAVTSVLPPAAKPTINRIGFAGQAVWACACPSSINPSANASEIERRIVSPPFAPGVLRASAKHHGKRVS
jgi:hypothetical protein